MASPSDPWNWSVDDVIKALCNSPNLWLERPGSKPPDPTFLEKVLRENDVNGSTLLSDVTPQVLQQDFQISSLGQRAAIRWAIEKYKAQSDRFLAEQRSSAARQHSIVSGLSSEGIAGIKREREPSEPQDTSNQDAQQSVIPAVTRTTEVPNAITPGTNPRQHETIIIDESNRKRRKLNLGGTYARPRAEGKDSNPGLKAPSLVPRVKGYLRAEKLPIDDLFFGDTEVGQELQFDPSESDQDAAQETFVLAPVTGGTVGTSNYVAKQMQHFQQNSEAEEVNVPTPGSIAVWPYRATLTHENNPSALLFEPKDNQVVVTRHNAFDTNQHTPTNEWDFLLHWQDKRHGSNDPEELPAYGDSDSEAELSESFIEELLEEQREAPVSNLSKYLAKENISSAIDDAFESYAVEWRNEKQAQFESRAWKVWRKYHKSRINRIQDREATILHCDDRLEEQKRWYLGGNDYKSAADVRKRCKNSQQTVETREAARFEIDVLNRPNAPARPLTAPKVKKPKKPVPDDDGDSIIISSESESEADIDDFVIQDDIDFAPAEVAFHDDSQDNASPPPRMKQEPDAAIQVISSDEPMQVNSTGGRPLDNSIIDLTLDDVDESNEPDPGDASASITSATSPVQSSHLNELESVRQLFQDTNEADVKEWEWDSLEEDQYRSKLILKMLLSLTSDQYQSVRTHLVSDEASDVIKNILETLQDVVLQNDFSKMVFPGATEAKTLAYLFIAWRVCRHALNGTADLRSITSFLTLKDKEKKRTIEPFRQRLMLIFERFPSPVQFTMADPANDDEDEQVDSSSEDTSDSVDGKNRRKKGPQIDPRAAERRKKARLRQEQSQFYSQLNLNFSQSQGQDFYSETGGPLIQVNESGDNEPQVFLNPEVAARMQQHQVEGVRFMWREVVEGMEGCLLAHTMGLGKTMQSITFLLTLVEASRDSSLSIPVELRQSRTLILCPAALINNWIDEFQKWIPGNARSYLGQVFSIQSNISPATRFEIVKKGWKARGGILLIGYELFARIVAEDPKATSDLSKDQQKEMGNILLTFPTLILADEAHKMKNLSSKMSKAASRLTSRYRIALTGSPLANNLLEYFAMVDWVSPGFLGSSEEFRHTYQNPIEEGLFKDSTPYAHRKALRKLYQLRREIEPKVHRANIEVLRGNLKPKVEFVVTVGLTKLQQELYTMIVRGFQSAATNVSGAKITNAKIWNWLRLLVLVCNHPETFLKKLSEITQPSKAQSKGTPEGDDVEQDELPLEAAGLPSETIASLKKMLSEQTDLDTLAQSTKVELLFDILGFAGDANDRVLVFSHSLLTLDYLERALKKRSTPYLRLDGSSKPIHRLEMAKRFNAGKHLVFLISTRAGSTGFNLPGANRVVIFDFNYNPVWEEQAIGRAYRLGQTKPVFVYRFVVGGTFEEVVYNKAVFKTQLAYRAVEKKDISRQAVKPKDFLFEPRDIESQSLEEHVGKDKEVLDRLLAIDPTQKGICSITTTETLQTEAADEKISPEDEREAEEELKQERLKKERPREADRRVEPILTQNVTPSNPLLPAQDPAGPSHTVQQSSNHDEESARQEKIDSVMRSTTCQSPHIVRVALMSTAWRVEDAIKKLEETGYRPATATTAASTTPNADKVQEPHHAPPATLRKPENKADNLPDPNPGPAVQGKTSVTSPNKIDPHGGSPLFDRPKPKPNNSRQPVDLTGSSEIGNGLIQRKRKRLTSLQHQSDGAFDMTPKLVDHSSPKLDRSAGAFDMSRKPKKVNIASSPGFRMPPSLSQEVQEAYGEPSEENGVFDLSHLSDGSSVNGD